MTTIAVTDERPELPLSNEEFHAQLLKIVNSDATPLGKMFREHFGLADEGKHDLRDLKFERAFIELSATEDEEFFINQEKGFDVSFHQIFEYRYLKEKHPDVNLGFLFKNKTYSFFEEGYEEIHDYFEVLLSHGIKFTVKKIELVTVKLDSEEEAALYAVEFTSTEKMSTFHKAADWVDVNMLDTLRPCGVILDDLNPFNYVSQEDCMKREVLEFRKALSDSMLNELDGAMGKVSDLDSCFSQVPPSL